MRPTSKCHLGITKFSKLGLRRLCVAITLCADLRSKWGLKESYNPHREISNDMLHTTYMQGNQINSQLWMVRNQFVNLIPGPSFGHKLCFKCPNWSCKPILNIYVPKYFQYYKEHLNQMGFDPWNYFLKIWDSIETLIPKVGSHLGVWVFIITLSHNLGLPFWLAPLQALAFVTSPRLGLWHKLCESKWLVPPFVT
jgi:hypothetical protein